MNAIVLTFDTDWVPEPILSDTLDILKDFNAVGVFFVTSDVQRKSMHRIKNEGHELGIHPYIGSNNDISLKKSISELQKITGGCASARCHSLLTSTNILKQLKDHGITYTSNYYFRRSAGIVPLDVQWGIKEFPIFEMDYFILAESYEKFCIKPSHLQLFDDGMKVLCLHPIHIFLNSPTLHYYENLRANFSDYEKLKKNRFKEYGIRNFLFDLLNKLKLNNKKTTTFSQII